MAKEDNEKQISLLRHCRLMEDDKEAALAETN